MSRILVALVLAAVASFSWAQSVVVNGGFSTAAQLEPWVFNPDDPNMSVEWSPLDANGDPDSGSVLIGNHHTNAKNGVTIRQCLPVQAGADYQVGGKVRVPSGPGQSLDDRASVAVRWASDTACSVFVTGSIGSASTVNAFDTWIQRGPTTRTAPANAQSVEVRALASKIAAGGSYFVQFDDLFLIPPDLIFADRFE